MDLLEVEIGQRRVAAFDGRVLEIFGGPERRFHVKLLTVSVSGPDKRGIRQVRLEQYQGTGMTLDEAAFAQFQPLLDALRTAGVTVTE
jgi:hypothetical protein